MRGDCLACDYPNDDSMGGKAPCIMCGSDPEALLLLCRHSIDPARIHEILRDIQYYPGITMHNAYNMIEIMENCKK